MTSNLRTASRRQLLAECRTFGIRGGSLDTEAIRAALLEVEAVNMRYTIRQMMGDWDRLTEAQKCAALQGAAVQAGH